MELRQRLKEKETQLEVLTQQLQATRQNLQSRETEITLLSREREVWPVSLYLSISICIIYSLSAYLLQSAVNHTDNGSSVAGNRASTYSDTVS